MAELIECDRCGRSITTDDAAGMLAAITGPCPSCGGNFRLAEPAATAGRHPREPGVRPGPP